MRFLYYFDKCFEQNRFFYVSPSQMLDENNKFLYPRNWSTKARNNPILKKLAFTDKILASLRGEFSYEKILDKLLSIAKKIEDNPNTTLEDFYEKVIYKLDKNSKATNSQRIGVEGVLKAVIV